MPAPRRGVNCNHPNSARPACGSPASLAAGGCHAYSIANGILHLDRSEDVDAIIVGRGGGSDSNFQPFDSEQVTEAIFTANTPVVTTIGHTED
ncbi:exodeoxyribonuclease VII large subunit [Haladaptatus sp. NG-WS-4]